MLSKQSLNKLNLVFSCWSVLTFQTEDREKSPNFLDSQKSHVKKFRAWVTSATARVLWSCPSFYKVTYKFIMIDLPHRYHWNIGWRLVDILGDKYPLLNKLTLNSVLLSLHGAFISLRKRIVPFLSCRQRFPFKIFLSLLLVEEYFSI